MDLARASYGTSAVAEYYAWSAGIIPRPHHTALCAHVTAVWKRGGHPRPPASRNLGISATLTERCPDPTNLLAFLQALENWRYLTFLPHWVVNLRAISNYVIAKESHWYSLSRGCNIFSVRSLTNVQKSFKLVFEPSILPNFSASSQNTFLSAGFCMV